MTFYYGSYKNHSFFLASPWMYYFSARASALRVSMFLMVSGRK